MSAAVLGLDIGGANLKAFHTAGIARSHPFALWRNPTGLGDALRALVLALPPADALAVTMTGELCDCFASKRAGVAAILDAVRAVAGQVPVHVWRSDGTFAELDLAAQTPLLVAASNWLALATFAGRFAPRGPALLLDVGSTTTDIVPLLDGQPAPRGRTDPERLASQELIYTGARRTPLCALLGEQVAAELFATTLDAYLVLHEIEEVDADTDTADGRPATRAQAHARLARMLCADLETSTAAERLDLARRAAARQMAIVAAALGVVAGRLPAPPATVVLAGSGEFVAAQALTVVDWTTRVVSLRQALGAAISTAACAAAVAQLAVEANR